MQKFRESTKFRENTNLTKNHTGTYTVEMRPKTLSRFLRKNQHFFRQINVFTQEVTKAKTGSVLRLKLI